jgi:hypothetical protein
MARRVFSTTAHGSAGAFVTTIATRRSGTGISGFTRLRRTTAHTYMMGSADTYRRTAVLRAKPIGVTTWEGRSHQHQKQRTIPAHAAKRAPTRI